MGPDDAGLVALRAEGLGAARSASRPGFRTRSSSLHLLEAGPGHQHHCLCYLNSSFSPLRRNCTRSTGSLCTPRILSSLAELIAAFPRDRVLLHPILHPGSHVTPEQLLFPHPGRFAGG
jgi:hypothetical protein